MTKWTQQMPLIVEVESVSLLTDEQVKFVGFRKDIKNLFKGSDLYINSSEHHALDPCTDPAKQGAQRAFTPQFGQAAPKCEHQSAEKTVFSNQHT